MVTPEVLVDHLLATVLVWSWAYIAGYPLAQLLRVPLGFAACILLGIAYWAVALYVFPFRHGLDIAAAIVVVGTLANVCRGRRSFVPVVRCFGQRSSWIMLAGVASFATPLFTQYVPLGMDASMHSTATHVIAANRGFSEDYAPIVPGLKFPPVNLGASTLAAMATRCGLSAVSATLAAEHLTYSAVAFATFLMLRFWVGRTPAAVLGVFAIWIERGMQGSVTWGGFPTVTSLAIGVFATRLVVDCIRRPSYRAAVPLAFAVSALPLIHGVSAAVWVYWAAPAAMAIGLFFRSRRYRAAIGPLVIAAGLAVTILAQYLVVARPRMNEAVLAWTRDWQTLSAPEGHGWELLYRVPLYLCKEVGSYASIAWSVGLVVLIVRRKTWNAFALLLAFVGLCLLVVNSRVWALPLSELLYPERVLYWFGPFVAVSLALAWRSLAPLARQFGWVSTVVAVLLLSAAFARHYKYFQRAAIHPQVTRHEWEALQWARLHLDCDRHFVGSPYNSAGSYLPAVAGIPVNGWHTHHMIAEDVMRVFRDRQITHLFVVRGQHITDPVGCEIVFENAHVRILKLKSNNRSFCSIGRDKVSMSANGCE